MSPTILSRTLTAVAVAALVIASQGLAFAHWETLEGLLAEDARRALDLRDPTPVLKWVRESDEEGVRAALERATAPRMRKYIPPSHKLFIITVLQMHRAAEGEGALQMKRKQRTSPAVAEAEKALAASSPDGVLKMLYDDAEDGLLEHFTRAASKYADRDESLAAGREFARAYVEYLHYVERHQLPEAEKPAEPAKGKHVATK